MKYVKLILAGLVIAISINAEAVTVMGARGCGEWVNGRSNNVLTYETWLIGYLSGVAVSDNVDILKNADLASLTLWMDNYCNKYPLNDIQIGTKQLVKELESKLKHSKDIR